MTNSLNLPGKSNRRVETVPFRCRKHCFNIKIEMPIIGTFRDHDSAL